MLAVYKSKSISQLNLSVRNIEASDHAGLKSWTKVKSKAFICYNGISNIFRSE